jgi:hypothetical protein|tara:strand:- start:1417 stop:1620 length:204 start_codon:yes stop_codon:yes gene_type:complete
MGFKFDNEEKGRWSEFAVGFKWPHQGLTIGYDLVEPHTEEEIRYYSILLYLGPITLIYNWGNHDWNE